MTALVYGFLAVFVIAYVVLLWLMWRETRQFKGGLTRDGRRHFTETRQQYDVARGNWREARRFDTPGMIELQKGSRY